MTAPSPSDPAAASTCLVLLLKAPQRSKRRLAQEIGELATAAARHMTECALEDLAEWSGSACFAPQEPGDEAWLRQRIAADARVVLQKGGNLGQRINHVDRALRTAATERSMFIGSDCPGMDGDYLLRAARALDGHDVVLGPALDGGVVLMGAKLTWPDLSDLPWSSAALFETLKRLCEDHGHAVAVLDPRMDVDTLANLAAIDGGLENDERPARRALARWLSEQTYALGLGP